MSSPIGEQRDSSWEDPWGEANRFVTTSSEKEHVHGSISPRPTQRDRPCISRARHDWYRFPHVSAGTRRRSDGDGDHSRQRAIWPRNLLQDLGRAVPRTYRPADWQHQVRLGPGDLEGTHCLHRRPVPAWIFCCRLKQHARHPAPLPGRPQGRPSVGLRGASGGRAEAQHGSTHGAQLLHQPLRFRGRRPHRHHLRRHRPHRQRSCRGDLAGASPLGQRQIPDVRQCPPSSQAQRSDQARQSDQAQHPWKVDQDEQAGQATHTSQAGKAQHTSEACETHHPDQAREAQHTGCPDHTGKAQHPSQGNQTGEARHTSQAHAPHKTGKARHTSQARGTSSGRAGSRHNGPHDPHVVHQPFRHRG